MTLSLAATLTIASAASMALEIAAGRMIAPYVGMSLYTWTAVIAVVLAGLAVGHWVGGVLAQQIPAPDAKRSGAFLGVEKAPAQDRGREKLFLILLAAALTAFASQFLLRAASAPLLGGLAPVSAVVAITTLAFFLPSFFAGAVGPLATFLAIEAAPDARGKILGRMYALGAVGAIAGVLLSGLVLIPYLGSSRTVAAIAAAYALGACLVSGGMARIVAVAAALLALGVTAAFGATWTPCERESGYFCIRVDDTGPGSRVLALDHLAHGVNDRDDPTRLHSPYIALIDEIVQRRFPDGPRAAFFVGGGAYTLPRAWAARWPEAAMTVAEIDPEVTRMARDRLWLDAPLTIRHRDARLALAEESGRFDAIVGDAFADISIPPHLVTDEFHALVAARLSPGGVYAMNVVDLLRHPRFVTSLAATLRQRFPSVELWLDESAVSPAEGRTTWIVLASDRATDSGSVVATDGSARSWVRVPLDGMLRVVPESQRVTLTDDHAPVARLLGRLLTDRRFAE